MLTLYSYPPLCGVADNNGYGLKVFAVLRFAGVPFVHQHILDASKAPRGQLPYIVDDGEAVGDSDTIIAYVTRRHGAGLDTAMTGPQRDAALMVSRTLDDLYWVMSYSRWKDEAFWPAFRVLMRSEHPQITAEAMEKARAFNGQRYYYQGIGRFAPDAAYARGLADLAVLANLVPDEGHVFGERPSSVDAALYGFVANFLFLPIETPLKRFVTQRQNLVRHCEAIHAAVGGAAQ